QNPPEVFGWSEEAPYDGILTFAQASDVVARRDLLRQLRVGGRLVLPWAESADPEAGSILEVYEREPNITANPQVLSRLEDVRFVPLQIPPFSIQQPDRAGLEEAIRSIPRGTPFSEVQSLRGQKELRRVPSQALGLPGADSRFIFEVSEVAAGPVEMLITHLASGNRWFGKFRLLERGLFVESNGNGFVGLKVETLAQERIAHFWIDVDGGKLVRSAEAIPADVGQWRLDLRRLDAQDSAVSLTRAGGLEEQVGQFQKRRREIDTGL
ncbi:MAG: hypothetical protein HYZ90_04660, partial [Candidatus Omnitrophica bacterium]|nr:hypothetical protein [Candidatus Omnitrophota bacterium]